MQALAIAEDVEIAYPQVYVLNILSFYSNSRSSQEAHQYLSRALELAKKADNYLLGWTYEMMGLVYFTSCEYQKTLDCYMKSYLDNEEKGAHAFQTSPLREVAMTAFAIGDYEMAIEFYNLAARQAGKLNWREQQLALELTSIGVTNAMKRVDLSWQTLNHVNERVLASDSHDLKNHALFAEGDILLQEARWTEAKGLFEQVLAHNETDIYALIGLSQACYELSHTTEALQYAHYVLQVAKDQQRFPADTLWDLVEFANPLTDFEKAALLSYVIYHRGTVFNMRERANRLLSEMQPSNDPDWIESAKEHFLDMALDDLIGYLLEKYAPTEDTVAD
ncbi:MAG: hypothetical protein CL607_16370 [Anaerolineaceae bacterium]|nr:hypothetical protein [Anaerolineaceae bacterium]